MKYTCEPSIASNLMCIVYHDEKLSRHYIRQLKLTLQQIFEYTRTFIDTFSLADYLNRTFIVNKLVIIVSGDEAKFLCETIEHDKELLKDPLVYELQFDKKPLKSQLLGDRKFQCVDGLFQKIDNDITKFVTIESRCDSTDDDSNELDLQQEIFPFGIYDSFRKQQSFCYLSREELKFNLFQSFIEVLLRINIDEKKALEQMWTSCREAAVHQNDYKCIQQIDKWNQEYNSAAPVKLYTQSSSFFRMINKAFRLEDIETIFDFQPFILHMHQQLNTLRTKQRRKIHSPENVLLRGKKLSKSVLQQLEDNKNKLISMNGFLSTTKGNDEANIFAGTGTSTQDYLPVVFEMHIDETIDTIRPYADISSVSTIEDEQEVLFFMGFVWRIEAVDEGSNNEWRVTLKLSTDVDSDLTRRFDELNDTCTFFTLGKILYELGEYKNAISFYQRMLSSSTDSLTEKTRANIHLHIAISAFEDGSFSQALEHLQKAERILPESVPLDELRPFLAEDASPSLMCILMNKGLVYQKQRNPRLAEKSFNEALEKHGSDKDKALVYYNIGVFQFGQGKYENARNHFNNALRLTTCQVLKIDINQRLQTLNQILSVH
ncbi:unnamed protein product [Adineta steineri]|uniref:Uncharacterized protein n=1 Tax=Adineta steineri TaxID=433720 RepID=A0A815LQR9_9BILA|nr:unnamed protein product [Adineta steineri]CAF1413473.1 unnamed protein product [Adineta steineri]CAF3778364.1 unnamed protein product [Adineta steineri]CAF3892756.1 unnamed protein product [Adineta steineri]